MQIAVFTFIPVVAAILGAMVAVYRPPGPVAVSAIQHFAAGVVFAAAAGEILPDLKHAGAAWPVAIGGGVGVCLMLLIERAGAAVKGPVGLVLLVAVDILIDGLVLGLGFAAGQKAGILLTIALTIEVLFLGLTVAAELGSAANSGTKVIGLTALLVLLLPVGAALAIPVATLPAKFVTGFFAFGLVALLYLVTEELLVEAHETPDRPWVTALFFVGFLLLLLLEEAVG